YEEGPPVAGLKCSRQSLFSQRKTLEPASWLIYRLATKEASRRRRPPPRLGALFHPDHHPVPEEDGPPDLLPETGRAREEIVLAQRLDVPPAEDGPQLGIGHLLDLIGRTPGGGHHGRAHAGNYPALADQAELLHAPVGVVG